MVGPTVVDFVLECRVKITRGITVEILSKRNRYLPLRLTMIRRTLKTGPLGSDDDRIDRVGDPPKGVGGTIRHQS